MICNNNSKLKLLARIFFIASSMCLAAMAQAANVVIQNNDAAGEGFNDPTPVSAVPGNSATTLGGQRLKVAQAAAAAWGKVLSSSVDIIVGMTFDPLPCTARSATLGSAGPQTVHRDFSGAPRAGTWYVQALANSFAGSDIAANKADINAKFNSSIDNNNNCLKGINWWYGIGSPAPAGTIDLYGVLLHEIGHGIGFLSLVDRNNGSKLKGYDDAFMVHLEDHSLGKKWPSMTDRQRLASMTDTGDLHWTGPNAVANSGVLSGGVGASNHIRMYAPATIDPGSSVSHWDTTVTPNELMEPNKTPDAKDLVTYQLLRDIGWTISGSVTGGGTPHPDLIVQSPGVSDASLTPGQSFTVKAVVKNQGKGNAGSTTLRYYRSTDSTISTSDTQIATDNVTALSAGGTSQKSASVKAPATPGTYYIGACVDSVSGESDTGNNCSSGVQVKVTASGAPDLVVQSPGVSDASLTPGQSFTVKAVVKNQGKGNAGSTTLRYYRSTDSTISTSDTQIATDNVTALSAGGTSQKSASVKAPATPGTYYIGACVDSVSGESNTSNQCSNGVQVDVSAQPKPSVKTQAASDVGQTGATLNASVNPNGADTTVYYDYGPTSGYGSSVTYGSIGSGTSAVPTPQVIRGLRCGTPYHFRVRASNSNGTAYGGDRSFTTAACSPQGPMIMAPIIELLLHQ